MDVSIIVVSTIAVFCGFFAGLLGSPGFAIIVPLLMVSKVFSSFQIALGVYFLGVAFPGIVNASVFIINNRELINFKLNIIFTILFSLFSGLSIYFSKLILDRHKFYIAGLFQLFIGIWYLIYAKNLPAI